MHSSLPLQLLMSGLIVWDTNTYTLFNICYSTETIALLCLIVACVVDTVDILVLLVGAAGWRVRPLVDVTGEIKALSGMSVLGNSCRNSVGD